MIVQNRSLKDKRAITPKQLEQAMANCLACSQRHNSPKLFRDEICNTCCVWMDFKKVTPTPSKSSILRLVKAIRHEARDNGKWFESDTIAALQAVEKQLEREEEMTREEAEKLIIDFGRAVKATANSPATLPSFVEAHAKLMDALTANPDLEAAKRPSGEAQTVGDEGGNRPDQNALSFEFYVNVRELKDWAFMTVARKPFAGAKKFRAVEVKG